jgi:hypothetical protein
VEIRYIGFDGYDRVCPIFEITFLLINPMVTKVFMKYLTKTSLFDKLSWQIGASFLLSLFFMLIS